MNSRGDKRPFGNDNISSTPGTPRKQKRRSSPGETDNVLRNAKMTMANAKYKLGQYEAEDDTTNKLIQYIREIISKLDTSVKKKTTVGVFGKTGAGKSSLINAILGETDLLPSGSVCACTSVIIQVEANVTDSNYTAEIEFISKKEWEDEVKTLLSVLSEDGEDRDNAMFSTANEKITALYGEEGVFLTLEDLMKDDNFSEIPEFLRSETKKITREKASDLSDQIGSYVQHDDSSPGGCYWPVVKSVTIKVPHCKDFLEHVMIVDLPGTGDYNKTRDQMWRSKLRECSTVWIVSEINRAGSDKEAWGLVSDSVTDMAPGGECRSISFICTKTDDINPQNYMRSSKLKDDDFQILPEDPQYATKKKIACILHRNAKAKERVEKNFLQQVTLSRHFHHDVFTVSSEEFTKDDPILKPEETEIPKLKDRLRMYNDSHTDEVASHYISGALGILSLIQGFKQISPEMTTERSRLYQNLETDLQNALGHLHEYCSQICNSLEKLLSKGAQESEERCVDIANEVIAPKNKDGRGFHRTLTALCKNAGYYRSKKGETDLNRHLAKHMLQQINDAFSDFFPVASPPGPSHSGFSQRAPTEKDRKSNACGCSPDLIALKKERLQLEKEKIQLKREAIQQRERHHRELVLLKKTKLSILSKQLTLAGAPSNRPASAPIIIKKHRATADKMEPASVQGQGTEKTLQAKINKFIIIKEELMRKYENSPVITLMLNFLKMEERKLKIKLKLEIIQQKKTFYACLPESIKSTMQPGYTRAAEETGTGSMKKKQALLLEHINSSKSYMFQNAKTEMIELMVKTMHSNVEEIKNRLTESMEYALLNTDNLSFMDVSNEIQELKKLSIPVCD